MLQTFEKELDNINKEFYKYVCTIEKSLLNNKLDEDFFLIDLKEFDNKLIKFLALYHPQGEYLRTIIAYLKSSSFLFKIKKSVKNCLKKEIPQNPKINALYQNALTTITTLKVAINSDDIEDAYSSIISYEKIADELYKELLIEVKKIEDIEEVLKLLNIAKKLERISDSTKTIIMYLLFAKEGLDL